MFLVQNTIEHVLLSHCIATPTVFCGHAFKVNNIGICPYFSLCRSDYKFYCVLL